MKAERIAGDPVGAFGDPSARERGTEQTSPEGEPGYAVIPIDPGDFSLLAAEGISLDGNGKRIAYVGRGKEGLGPLDTPIQFLDRLTGVERRLAVDLGSSLGHQLSRDGERFFYWGFLTRDLITTSGIAMLSLEDGEISIVIERGLEFFSVDRTGTRIAFQSTRDLDPRIQNDEPAIRYFFYDEAMGEIRQLTSDPDAASRNTGRTSCPRLLATIPLISSDGSEIVLITSVTLGLVEDDPDVGCRIFMYDVADASWRHVVSLPKTISLDVPTLSNDARWLSFTSVRTPDDGIRRSFPALLDLQTGELTDPIGGISEYTSFDAVISGDASTVVISSQADLDPRVGNPDHNLELFAYDRETGSFTQMTDTIGGVGSTPGGCSSYLPKVSDDASVAVFASHRISVEGCRLDGPLRQRDTGFSFARVRAVKKRPGNQGPTLAPTADVHVAAGGTIRLEFLADDPDGDPISYFIQEIGAMDIPAGSTMTDHRDGTATFEWATTHESEGTYSLRVAAFDEGGGRDFYDVALTITPCAGDCNRDGQVSVDEVVSAINVALGLAPLTTCDAADADSNESVYVDELIAAAQNSIDGCGN